ncbi:MAG: hypothetical protein KAW41_01545 [Candidatus Diapherotrites archaeon]|nr:hypothetical protein [Candidatus Diapherotrites archaeon]
MTEEITVDLQRSHFTGEGLRLFHKNNKQDVLKSLPQLLTREGLNKLRGAGIDLNGPFHMVPKITKQFDGVRVVQDCARGD